MIKLSPGSCCVSGCARPRRLTSKGKEYPHCVEHLWKVYKTCGVKGCPKPARQLRTGNFMTRCADHHRENALLQTYKLSSASYSQKLEEQQNSCAICKSQDPGSKNANFSVDHAHKCCPSAKSCGKCVRGLLCYSCNRGYFHDNPVLLRAAANYFEMWERKRQYDG